MPQGSVAQETRCLRCRHAFDLRVDPFFLLPLAVPAAGSGGRTLLGALRVAPGTSLEGCLKRHCAYESVQGAECPR